MKIIITGRRAPDQSWTEMKRHMLDVHGPLVEREMRAHIASYVQNHVHDGRYGTSAPAGRDMVAELIFSGEGPPPVKPQYVIDDEPRFAHQSDLFPMLVEEMVIMPAPAPASGTEAARGFKALCYLAPRAGTTMEAFIASWEALDAAVLSIAGLAGYVRSTALPISPPLSPYKGVASLWFQPDNAEDGLATWRRLIADAALVKADSYFCLYVDEHRIIG